MVVVVSTIVVVVSTGGKIVVVTTFSAVTTPVPLSVIMVGALVIVGLVTFVSLMRNKNLHDSPK